ncbi:MAG: dethiobiotin synthase [Candidatus Methylacidiphilales bacterium]
MSQGFFITGTDTGVGKTWVTCLLVERFRNAGIPALGLKPIACGDRGDAEALARINGECLTLNEINPLYFPAPLAPYASSVLEERQANLTPVMETWSRLGQAYTGPFLVEGAGGWLVPITRDYWIKDLAVDFGLPVLVVCRASLGTLNHTLLTVESICCTGLTIKGLIMNHHDCPDDLASQTNAAVLEDLTGLPVWSLQTGEKNRSLPRWIWAAMESNCDLSKHAAPIASQRAATINPAPND